VPNGSFEDTIRCPSGSAEINLSKFFSSPTKATPDYFNSCALLSSTFSVPENGMGFQLAHSGNSYGGIVCYGYGTDYREYIQTSLLNSLKKGKYYYVEYYTSLGNNASVGCNQLGILFSSSFLNLNTLTNINSSKSISNSSLILDTLDWVKLSYYYKAEGDENYLIIGNFKNDFNTDTVTNILINGENYYYIDDISVLEIDYEIPNVFTPNSDGFNDVFYFNTEIINAKDLSIYNRWGVKMFQSSTIYSWNGRTTSGEECAVGTYYYVIQTETETYKGFLELIR
jgi:OmpA-OmpF porin, OOP family